MRGVVGPNSCAVTSAVASVGTETCIVKVRLLVSHETTVAVYVKLPFCRGKPDTTPLEARVRPCGNAPPVTLQILNPPPPLIRSVSAYVAPMTPLGRAFTDVIVALVPKLAVSAYGCCIPTVMSESVVVESPVHPQKLAPASTGVRWTGRPSGTKSPARLIAVSAVTEPPEARFFAREQAAYNAIIQRQATAHGWGYTDSVNTMLDSLAKVANQFAPFPNTAAACNGFPFGLAFSCDGVHPNQATQRLIARKLVRAINAKYGSAIPAVP